MTDLLIVAILGLTWYGLMRQQRKGMTAAWRRDQERRENSRGIDQVGVAQWPIRKGER